MTDRKDTLARAEEFVAVNAERQREDAATLRPGQCPGCGAYRLDGASPQVHEHGCPWEGMRRERYGEWLRGQL